MSLYHPRNLEGQQAALQALAMLVHDDPQYDEVVGAFVLRGVRASVETRSIPYELCGAIAMLSCLAERALRELAEHRGTTAAIELQAIALELAEHQAGLA
jgi:hypothetical protein